MTEINRTTSGPVLDDVLDEYAAAGPSREDLERWIREYPQFRQELTELTVSWLELKHLPPVPATTDPTTAQLRAESILGEVLHTLKQRALDAAPALESKEAPFSPAPLSVDSLLAQAQRQGLDVEQFACAVKMSVAMIMSLQRRYVNVASIPQLAMSALSSVLKLPFEVLYAYLNAPQQLAPAQHFKATQAPTVTEKMDFAALVEIDPDLSPEDRSYWLSAQSPGSEPSVT